MMYLSLDFKNENQWSKNFCELQGEYLSSDENSLAL